MKISKFHTITDFIFILLPLDSLSLFANKSLHSILIKTYCGPKSALSNKNEFIEVGEITQ